VHKDELIAEYLRRLDSEMMPETFDRADLTPREKLLAVFEEAENGSCDPNSLCPFIAAAVEIPAPEHPARLLALEYKKAIAARLTETAREAGAADPEQLGEQLALLLDGASARSRTLRADAIPTAAGIAAALVEQAIPEAVPTRSESPQVCTRRG